MTDAEKVAALFAAHDVEGTLVIESLDGYRTIIHNPERASEQFSPASTFKIPNTLIALEHGIVTSKDSPFNWDGTDRSLPQWNRDQTLESAFKVSCVWCYQEMARALGAGAYVAALRDLNYGNREIGAAVDQFWLNGDLRISAFQQIEFLRSFYLGDTGYDERHVAIVKDIMRVEVSESHTLYAKSGWTGAGLAVGWYVGFVETPGETWLFAMNMRMNDAAQAPLRQQLTVEALGKLRMI